MKTIIINEFSNKEEIKITVNQKHYLKIKFLQYVGGYLRFDITMCDAKSKEIETNTDIIVEFLCKTFENKPLIESYFTKSKTIAQLIDIIEAEAIKIDEVKEEGKLCGYELNTYTNGGVNQIVFLDFRDYLHNDKDVINPKDFIDTFKSYMKDFDIDETIMMYRQDKRYTNEFTLTESLKDFKCWKTDMEKLIKKLK